MLRVDTLDVFYGHIQALKGVSIQVGEGEIVALIGANGAGKTTMLRTISGLLRPAAGQISFRGTRIDGRAVEDIVAAGISHVPEGRRIFPGLTVLENLEIATCTWRGWGQSIAPDLGKVFRLFPRLQERTGQLGWSLSGGEQQMLAIARALMAKSALLLLDEPSLGLAPVLVQELFATIQDINRLGMTVLMVEQNAYLALEMAHRAYVMEHGEIVITDTADRLRENPVVKRSYLGG